MKKRMLDVCIYGICAILSVMWSIYVLQSMIIDLSGTTFSNTYAYVVMNLFDFAVALFICYTFAKSFISLMKYLQKEWAEGAEGRKAKLEQKKSTRQQKRLEKLQAEMDELKKDE